MAQHIGFEQRSRCSYDSHNCPNEPIYYLLMGCLNQHLSEGPVCAEHSNLWVEQYKNQRIPCNFCFLHIEEYLIFSASMLT